MSRRFRMTLFLCLAAATGLHLRPCLWTLRGGCEPAPALEQRDASLPSMVAVERGGRPSLGGLLAAPTLVGIEAAVAEAR